VQKAMRLKSLFIFSLLTVLVSFVFVFGVNAQTPNAKRKSASTKIKTLVVKTLDMEGLKKVLQRDANNPRPLLVNFWATWCDPCREEFPDLVKIDKEYKSKGLDFITISLDDLADIKTEVPKFLRKMKATMPAYLLNVEDQSEAIATVSTEWGGGLPATFLFDTNGQIVFSKTGIVRPDELKEAINKVLSSEF
jgi:thiol-disulfide isomerase/thioredoxin